MGSITFYIKKEDANIERQLKDMDTGELSAFITECIKSNSREYLEEKRDHLYNEIQRLDRILQSQDKKNVAFTNKAIEEQDQKEGLTKTLIEEQLQATEPRTPKVFNIWIETRIKKLGIDYNDITERYRVAWEEKEQRRKDQIEIDSRARREERERKSGQKEREQAGDQAPAKEVGTTGEGA